MSAPVLPSQPMAEEQRHDVIWLQAWCDGCDKNAWGSDGRQWCQDDAWSGCEGCERKSVKYILADSHASLKARIEELELGLRDYLHFLRKSLNVGPLTNNPTKEAALLRRLMELVADPAALPKQEPGA